jgi:hypothetical protein
MPKEPLAVAPFTVIINLELIMIFTGGSSYLVPGRLVLLFQPKVYMKTKEGSL